MRAFWENSLSQNFHCQYKLFSRQATMLRQWCRRTTFMMIRHNPRVDIDDDFTQAFYDFLEFIRVINQAPRFGADNKRQFLLFYFYDKNTSPKISHKNQMARQYFSRQNDVIEACFIGKAENSTQTSAVWVRRGNFRVCENEQQTVKNQKRIFMNKVFLVERSFFVFTVSRCSSVLNATHHSSPCNSIVPQTIHFYRAKEFYFRWVFLASH